MDHCRVGVRSLILPHEKDESPYFVGVSTNGCFGDDKREKCVLKDISGIKYVNE